MSDPDFPRAHKHILVICQKCKNKSVDSPTSVEHGYQLAAERGWLVYGKWTFCPGCRPQFDKDIAERTCPKCGLMQSGAIMDSMPPIYRCANDHAWSPYEESF